MGGSLTWIDVAPASPDLCSVLLTQDTQTAAVKYPDHMP